MNRSDLLTPHLPTDARPGSKLKRLVLRERVRLGLPLFLAGDRLFPRVVPRANRPRPGLSGPRATKGRVYMNTGMWIAYVGRVYLGRFRSEEEGRQAVDRHRANRTEQPRERKPKPGPRGRVYLICGKWMAWHNRTCLGRFPTEAAGWFAVEAHVQSLSAEAIRAA